MNDPMDKKSVESYQQPDVLVNLMEEFTNIYKDSADVSVAEREARCGKVQWKPSKRSFPGHYTDPVIPDSGIACINISNAFPKAGPPGPTPL